jgi:hypothetical protein
VFVMSVMIAFRFWSLSAYIMYRKKGACGGFEIAESQVQKELQVLIKEEGKKKESPPDDGKFAATILNSRKTL